MKAAVTLTPGPPSPALGREYPGFAHPPARAVRRGWRMVVWLGLALGIAAHAQNFAVDWFVVAGGGGAGANGLFAITGTLGQPAAARAAGGPFAVQGGFWSLVAVVPTPGAPELQLLRSGNNVTLSWDSAAPGFVLEETGSLNPPVLWQPVAGVSNNSLTTAVVPGRKFYRLRRP